MKSAVRPALLLLVFGVVLALSGCGGANSDTAASSSATTTTATSSSAASQFPPGVCSRQCTELKAILDLSLHSQVCNAVSGECTQELDRASLALQRVRQDLIDHGINRADYVYLDDTITKATRQVSDLQVTCAPSSVTRIRTTNDAATCATQTPLALGDVGGLVILLGGTP